ncbi:MAG: hypothetical protein EZS28_042269, partial [Streblomastix strix]
IVDALFVFTHPYSITISQLLFEKKPFRYLLRILDHQDSFIVGNAIAAIDNILYCGAIGSDESLENPYYEELYQQGGIQKIFKLFQQTDNQFNKDGSALCLGFAFKSREIGDAQMKEQIISHLQSIVNHNEEETRNEVKLALKFLSYNPVNWAIIARGGFVIPV